MTAPARPAPGRQRRLAIAAGVTAVIAAVVAIALAVALLEAPVRAGIVGWGPTVDGTIEVVVDIRHDTGVAGTCEVRAIDRRRAIVGTGEAHVAADDPAQVRVRVPVAVDGIAITAKMGDCRDSRGGPST